MDLNEFKNRINQKEQSLNVKIKENDTSEELTYIIKNQTTFWRAQTLFTKEPVTIKWIKSFVKDKIFFDVGANVGMYSILAAKVSKVKVYSFEPESNNFNTLIENIISNDLMDKVNAYPIAVSDKSGFTSLYLSKFGTGSSHHMVDQKLDHNLKEIEYKNKQGVFKSSLDEIISNWDFPNPNYLKIDVDGIENIIIKNSSALLKNDKLESILIEINRNRKEDLEIISILESNGFKYDDKQVEDSTRKIGSHKGYAEFLFYK